MVLTNISANFLNSTIGDKPVRMVHSRRYFPSLKETSCLLRETATRRRLQCSGLKPLQQHCAKLHMANFFPKLTVKKHQCTKIPKHFKAFKTCVFFQERVKSDSAYSIKAVYSLISSCLAMFNDLLWRGVCVFARRGVF